MRAARRPAMVLAENVPGLLSVNGGRDFGAIIASLLAVGYRVAWTILDARYFGVAQRRRRVFILAVLDRDPREMLFDGPELMPDSRGGPAAALIDGRWQSLQMVLLGDADSPFDGGAWPGSGYADGDRCWVRDVPEWREPIERASLATTLETGPIPARFFLSARACAGILRRAERRGRALPAALAAALRATVEGGNGAKITPGVYGEEASALSAHGGASGRLDFESESFVVGPIQAQGAGGRGRRVDAEAAAGGHLIADDAQSGVPFVVHAAESGARERHAYESDHARCLDGTGGFASAQGGTIIADQSVFAFESRVARNGRGAPGEVVPPLKAQSGGDGRGDGAPLVAASHAGRIRRLTTTECERLQNFPDGWTCLCGCTPYSTAACTCPDGPRYKMLGNAVCVAVVRWIAQRLVAP